MLRRIGNQVVSATGLPRLLHSYVWRRSVTILSYHAVTRTPLGVDDWCFLSEDKFRSHLTYLKRHFRMVPLSTAIALLQSDSVEQPTVVLTFDDGYQNNYDVVFPLLAEHNLPATIFLATSFVDSSRIGWWCALNNILALTNRPHWEWQGQRFDLSDSEHKTRASAMLQHQLKACRPAAVEQLVSEICRELNPQGERNYGKAPSPYQMLDANSIRKMSHSGLIEFGAHTHNHTILSLLSKDEQREEIVQSIAAVEALTGKPCNLFAYPNGRREDYDQNCMDVLKARGVAAAVSMVPGPNLSTTPPLELHRYGIGADIEPARFESLVHHIRI